MFHKWLFFLLWSASYRREIIRFTFEIPANFVWNMRKLLSPFSMSMEVTYFALWRLFFVNLRQFVQRLMVIYSILLLLKAWIWLIIVLLRKMNWVFWVFNFLILLLKLLLLFFLVEKQEILVCLTAYNALLNLLALINKIVVRRSLLLCYNCLIKFEVVFALWLLLGLLLGFNLHVKADAGQIREIVQSLSGLLVFFICNS